MFLLLPKGTETFLREGFERVPAVSVTRGRHVRPAPVELRNSYFGNSPEGAGSLPVFLVDRETDPGTRVVED